MTNVVDIHAALNEWQQEENTAQAAQEIRQRLFEFDRHTPVRYRAKGWDDFHYWGPDARHQQKCLHQLKQFVHPFVNTLTQGTNLCLLGQPGTGKTLTSIIMARDILSQGHDISRCTFTHYMETMLSGTVSARQRFQRWAHVDWLIVDELTTIGYKQAKAQHHLFQLIDARYQAKKPMCLISYHDWPTLKAQLGCASVDRILENHWLCEFNWNSYRQHGQGGVTC